MKKTNKTKVSQTFFINTLIIVATGFLIKILGLANRIFITRLLGTEGMSLYILSFPTIVLFINLSSFSLNVSTSKLVASSLKTRKYSPRQILYQSLRISFFVSLISIAILLIIIRPLTSNWLNNEKLFYPLLTTVILIPLVGISDTIKGYFSGLKQMGIPSLSTLFEQIARIIFGIGFIIILMPYGLVLATSFTLLALSAGELISICYLIYKLKKEPPLHFPNTTGEKKAILSITLPNTGTRLIGSFTYFLEPIVYTSALLWFGYSSHSIETNYTIINAYAIPLMTTASFLSFGIAQAIIPNVSENYALGKMDSIRYYVKKSFLFSFVPGILFSILFFTYPSEFMQLIYDTTQGAEYIPPFIFFFLLYYLQPPVNAILQALGKSKTLFITSTIFNILRVILIVVFSGIKSIGLDSIFWSIMVTMVLNTLINIIQLILATKYRFELRTVINIILLTISTLILRILLKLIWSPPFLINVLIISIFFTFFSFYLKIISIESFIKEKNPRQV